MQRAEAEAVAASDAAVSLRADLTAAQQSAAEADAALGNEQRSARQAAAAAAEARQQLQVSSSLGRRCHAECVKDHVQHTGCGVPAAVLPGAYCGRGYHVMPQAAELITPGNQRIQVHCFCIAGLPCRGGGAVAAAGGAVAARGAGPTQPACRTAGGSLGICIIRSRRACFDLLLHAICELSGAASRALP